MKKFVFSLQKVLELREYEEDKAKLELGKAVVEVERLKRLLEENARNRIAANQSRKDTNDISVLLSIEHYIIGLDSKREKLLEELTMAQMFFEEKRDLYTKAMQDREVLSKLKEKQLSEYKKEVLKEEENALDDIVKNKEL